MPKMKTRKSIQKRFRITKNGKVMHMHQGKSHLRMAKSKRVRGSYDEMTAMSPANRVRIMRLLPYGVK